MSVKNYLSNSPSEEKITNRANALNPELASVDGIGKDKQQEIKTIS